MTGAHQHRGQKAERLRRVTVLRIVQAGLTLGVLALADYLARQDLSPGWWWLTIGVGTLVSASLLEPHFTDARSAVANAIAGLAAWASADRATFGSLWLAYAAFALLLLAFALISLSIHPGRLRTITKWLATRLARARIIGYSALSIEVLRVAAHHPHGAIELALGLAGAIILSSLDWNRLVNLLPLDNATSATVEVATEPNLILIASSAPLKAGTRVKIQGELGASEGTVLTPLAHRSGSRYQAVLEAPWWSVVPRADSECLVTTIDDKDDCLGFAAEGSTEKAIEVHPVQTLEYGQPMLIESADKKQILYQVSAMRLERSAWDNSSVIEPRARAVQIGLAGEDSIIAFAPYLPAPYQMLHSASTFKVGLNDRFKRIGVITGTGVEIGVDPEAARGSHLAILGMSGMGKTTVARRICNIMMVESGVVALDGTGEYSNKLGFDALPGGSKLSDPGEWVKEPAGDPPGKCKEFIKEMMGYASDEYKAGSDVKNRTLLLEEAHSFLPEWNFATKTQTDAVSESCRYILQARKFGISFIFVSQRTAVISKSALSQCESYIIFRTLDQTSLDYVEGVVGADLREAVSSLGRHQAICVGPAFNSSSPVIVSLDPAD